MEIFSIRPLYDEVLYGYKIDGGFAEKLEYVKQYCGGMVWSEIEQTEQKLPINARYIDTYYNINVYYDFTCDCFLFEEFN